MCVLVVREGLRISNCRKDGRELEPLDDLPFMKVAKREKA